MDEIIAAGHSLVINDQYYNDGDSSNDEYWMTVQSAFTAILTELASTPVEDLMAFCRERIKFAEAARIVNLPPSLEY